MTVFIIVILALAFHVAIIYAIATKHFNALYLIGALFAFLSPISTASLLPHFHLVKIGRVYTTVLLIVVGFLAYRLLRMGPVSWIFTAFITYYCLGALWSDQLVDGVLYKGLFGAVFLSGLLMANSTSTVDDLRVGVRILAFSGAAFAIFVLAELVRNPDAITHVGRLQAFGMNPNRIGQEAAAMFIFAAFLALYERQRFWKAVGYSIGGAMAILILYSGSRGAAGMAMIGGVALALPLAKRPGALLVTSIIVGSVVYYGLGLVEQQARERLAYVTFSTRDGVWAVAFETFREAPIFGSGWYYIVHADGSAATRNAHSIYIQALVEIGIVGMLLMTAIVGFASIKALQAWRYIVQFPQEKQYGYFMMAVFLSVFAHGVIESSTFIGTSVNAMLLGFSIGLIDRLPGLTWQREEERTWSDLEEPDLYAHEDDHAPLPAY